LSFETAFENVTPSGIGCTLIEQLPNVDGDDCFYYYEQWFSTLDRGSLRSNLDYQRFQIVGGLRSHLVLFFFARKNMLKKKAVSPRSHPASQHIRTHVYFVHIFKYIYAEI